MQPNIILGKILNSNSKYSDVKNIIYINKKINKFNYKKIDIPGDKSLSVRFVILSSLAKGKSVARNLLTSEDVISTIKCIRKFGINIKLRNNCCEVFGKGLNGYKYKENIILDAGNSGTAARLLSGAIIDTSKNIIITGDSSLKKRDMTRIINPLKKIGIIFKNNNGRLPLNIRGSNKLKPIKYLERLGSAQCKSAVMIAALKIRGTTKLKCLPSRNHTELMFKKVLKLPIKIKKKLNYDFIEIEGNQNYNAFNYKIPGDISSASFLIVLTLLSEGSQLTIKKVNINKSRIGIIKILNMMGAKIKFKNKKIYKGEPISDILVKYCKTLKSINLDSKLNSSAIDEFLLIFLVASVSKGVSNFKNLSELNKKESKRLDWGHKILKMIGSDVKLTKNNGIRIKGNPKLSLDGNYHIKGFLKDHRIFMVSVVTALALGGNWKIYDPDSVKTSFPNFLDIIKKLGGEIN
jgi:3-phosphoshikimate 1-carboxyvinyltransferase